MTARRTAAVERPARLPGAERREHLLDVAGQLVLDDGLDGVTMEGVAARAGVSKGLGYAYFANRDELLAALYDREMSMLDQRVARAVALAPSLEEKVRVTLVEWFDHLAERGEIVGRLTRAQLAHGPVEERRKARQKANDAFWTDLVMAELQIPRHLAKPIVAAVMSGAGALLDSWVSRKVSRTELIPAYTAYVMGGLRSLAALSA
jgi:AcrR family transcriptional regulator